MEEVSIRRSTIQGMRRAPLPMSGTGTERGRGGRRSRSGWLHKKEEDWQGEVLSLDKVGLTTLDRMLRADDEEGRGHMPETHQGGFKVTTDGLIRQRRERSRCSRGPH